jgi:hypothetical protein
VGFWHAGPPVENADCGAESSAKPRKDASKIFKRRAGRLEIHQAATRRVIWNVPV